MAGAYRLDDEGVGGDGEFPVRRGFEFSIGGNFGGEFPAEFNFPAVRQGRGPGSPQATGPPAV
jgi:hypothetical protein